MENINTREFIENVENYCKVMVEGGKSREQAEQSLQSVFKLNQPYQLFFTTLKESKSTLVHFYMLMGIRDAAIREWAVLESQLKLQIIDTLYQYCLNLNSMPFLLNSTKNQSYNTLSVICKRSWLDQDKYQNGLELNQIIMEKIYSDLDSNQFNQMEASVQLIHGLIVEFSSKSNSSRIQLTWEYHLKCLTSFQSLHLQPIFRRVMSILSQLQVVQMNQLTVSMLNITLKIFTDILEWRFADKGFSSLSFISSFSSSQHSLKPNEDWANIFITKSNGVYSSQILDVIFKLYPTISSIDKLSSLLRSSITQVVTLTGPILKNSEDKNAYLLLLLERITPILEKCIQSQNWTEMQDIAHSIHRLCLNFKLTGFLLMNNHQVLVNFFKNIVRFVFSALELMKQSMINGEEDLESEIELDCLDILLRGWVALITDLDGLVAKKKTDQFEHFNDIHQVFKMCSNEIYQGYIKTRLELSKIELAKYDSLEPDNDDNNDLNEDKNKYEEQLKAVSYIGRVNPIQSMDTLSSEITNSIQSLKEKVGDPVTFEALHWLIIFSGHILFDSDNDSLSPIPNNVELESYKQYTTTQGSRDSIIDLTNAIIKFSMEYENPLLQNNQIDRLSPLVSKTLIWFFSGWTLVYLIPSESLNLNVSPKLLESFASESSVKAITDFFIQKILINLKYWAGDFDVLKETCKLFYNLSLHSKLIKFMISSSSWSNLFFLREQGFEKLAPEIQASLYKAILNVIYKLPTTGGNSEIRNYFEQFTRDLSNQLDSVLSHQNFQSIAQEAYVKENLYLIFEKLKGILSVPAPDNDDESDNNTVNDIRFLSFDLFMKYANSFIAMLSIYDHLNDIVQIILSLFSNFTKFQISLDQQRATLTYTTIINLFQSASKITNSLSSTDKNKEYYNRIKILIKILYNIITYGDPQNDFPKLISKTVFNGINIITPCLTNKYNLLQYPKLARNYFSILTYIFNSDDISEISNFPVEISNSIFRLIESGLLHHDTEIVRGCFECIAGLTKFSKNLKSKNIEFDSNILSQYIGSVINFLLLNDFNADELLATASESLFDLIISNTSGYQSKVLDLIQRQEQSTQQRILKSFESLNLTGTDRKSKEAFLTSLKELLMVVKPLLKKQ